MKRFRWALASTCISWLLAAPPAAAGGKDEARRPTLVEAEYEVARESGVYLVVQPQRRAVAVRSRGLTLESIPVGTVALLQYRPTLGEEPEALQAPVFFTVSEDPEATHRKLIAPSELRPYPDPAEEEAPAEEENAELPVSTAPAAAEPLPTPPSAYRIDLEDGWQLYVGQEVPSTGFWRRLVYALQDGWQHLLGREPEAPRLLVVAADVSQAQKLHHLFRSGTRILFDPS